MKYSWNICWLSFDRRLHSDFTQLDSTLLDSHISKVFILPPEFAFLEGETEHWLYHLHVAIFPLDRQLEVLSQF